MPKQWMRHRPSLRHRLSFFSISGQSIRVPTTELVLEFIRLAETVHLLIVIVISTFMLCEGKGVGAIATHLLSSRTFFLNPAQIQILACFPFFELDANPPNSFALFLRQLANYYFFDVEIRLHFFSLKNFLWSTHHYDAAFICLLRNCKSPARQAPWVYMLKIVFGGFEGESTYNPLLILVLPIVIHIHSYAYFAQAELRPSSSS